MSNAEIRGRFVWHELMTTDTDAASDFYSRVVPWKTEDSGMPSYSLWMSGKTRAGGLMALPQEDGAATPPHWIIYIGTPDVDATVAEAEKLGGKILKPASDIPNVGRFAVLSDPQGAAFAVFNPSSVPDEGVGPGGGVGDFTWHELATTDTDAATSFYVDLFGWTKGPAHDMGEFVYQIVEHGGAQVGGIYKVRDNSTPPNWLSYVRVADAAKAANAVKDAGGRILNGPMEVPGGSWIVQALDPQGGAFAIVESAKTASAAANDDEPAAPKKAAKRAKKAPAKKAPAKAPAKSAAAKSGGAPAKAAGKGKAAGKKAAKKAVGKTAAGKAAAGKAAKKAAKKAVKKVVKKAAKKGASKPAAKRAVARKVAKKSAKPVAKTKGKAARKK